MTLNVQNVHHWLTHSRLW